MRLFDLLIMLLPLIIGYLIPLPSPHLQRIVQHLLGWMVYCILFLMGVSLGLLENLADNLLLILQYVTITSCSILGVNLLVLLVLERSYPWRSATPQQELPSRLGMTLESLRLCSVVVLGFLLGLSKWDFLHHVNQGSSMALLFLLLLVGIQLGNSDISLRQITLNRRGTIIAVATAASALVGGIIAALLLGLPIHIGLALASGYGWYSLSGIVMTEAFGPLIGSTAFFNDLARELLSIILIPSLIRRNRSVALGLSGATSLDFTLPILQRSGGMEIVPPAIVHGFLLSLLAPVLMGLFSS